MLHVLHPGLAFEPAQDNAAWRLAFCRHFFGPIKLIFHPVLHAAYEPDGGKSAWQSVTSSMASTDLYTAAGTRTLVTH